MKKNFLKQILSVALIIGMSVSNALPCFASVQAVENVQVNELKTKEEVLNYLKELEEKYGISFDLQGNAGELETDEYINISKIEELENIIANFKDKYEENIDITQEAYLDESEDFNAKARQSNATLSVYTNPASGLKLRHYVNGKYYTRAGKNYWQSVGSYGLEESTSTGFSHLGEVSSVKAVYSSSTCITMTAKFKVDHFITVPVPYLDNVRVKISSSNVNSTTYFYSSRI